MAYVCMKCRKTSDSEDRIRCSYCGFRILAKARPAFRKRVKSR
ncbi:MAG: DNA-directed RNA polymerase subunit P [Candidatus Aenigmarchaeota archaeon]|nr:DNA-directed RNA polymerase subunit P [Candidatus Aenigmarchaeota archaeon]